MTVGGRDDPQRPAPDRPERRQPAGGPWTQIWFDGPDEAYLVAAAIRRHLDAVVRDVVLVPSTRGPALELPPGAARHPLVVALARRFGGHFDRRRGDDPVVLGDVSLDEPSTAVPSEPEIQ